MVRTDARTPAALQGDEGMNPDDEAEAALREAYGRKLREALAEFTLVQAEGDKEGAIRLFVHYGSFPAYSVWRAQALHQTVKAAQADIRQVEAELQAGRAGTPEERAALLGPAALIDDPTPESPSRAATEPSQANRMKPYRTVR